MYLDGWRVTTAHRIPGFDQSIVVSTRGAIDPSPDRRRVVAYTNNSRNPQIILRCPSRDRVYLEQARCSSSDIY
jgi:hypothetical protein